MNVWTIDSWRGARAPIELGAHGLIADYPNVTTFATGRARRGPPGRRGRGGRGVKSRPGWKDR